MLAWENMGQKIGLLPAFTAMKARRPAPPHFCYLNFKLSAFVYKKLKSGQFTGEAD
jgi:hypothetical protein